MKLLLIVTLLIAMFVSCDKTYNNPEFCTLTLLLIKRGNELEQSRVQNGMLTQSDHEERKNRMSIIGGSVCYEALKKRPTPDSLNGLDI